MMVTTLNVLAVALPVLLGLVVWFVQQLVQRSWDHYEQKRRAYLEVVSLLDTLFESGDALKRPEYLRAVRGLWLVGSDEVIKAIGSLHRSIRDRGEPVKKRDELYSQVVKEMREDLHRRSYLPPGKTSLSAKDFPVEGPGVT